MRPQFWSRVVAALMVLTVWLVSQVNESRAVEGVSTVAAAAPYGFCESRLEEKVQLYQRRQIRMEQARSLQQREQERLERTALLEHKRLVFQEQAVRTLAVNRIADLVPEQYQPLVLDAAERFGLDPRLIAAVGTVESQWHERTLGTHGDTGLMQILPPTAEWIAGKLGLGEYDLYDPTTNLTMGAWYLHILHAEYGNWQQALAVYNGGPGAAPGGAENPYTHRVLRVFEQQAP